MYYLIIALALTPAISVGFLFWRLPRTARAAWVTTLAMALLVAGATIWRLFVFLGD